MADTTGELYILLTEEQKKNEELQILASDLKIENGAMRMEIDDLKNRNTKLEEEKMLLQHQLDTKERQEHVHSETHTQKKILCI